MKLLVIICLVFTAPVSFAQSRAEQIDSAFALIESFREIPPGEFRFAPSVYREGTDMALSGLDVAVSGAASHLIFHSAKYGRVMGFVQFAARTAMGLGLITIAVGMTTAAIEMANATADGYRRVLPRVHPIDSLAHILMGSPQGYQSLIRMVKDPQKRENIRALALQDDEFFDFLTEFGTNQPRRKEH